MLRRKLYDYDFMGGIVAVYLGNSSNVEEALIKYFDSKESRGIWGFYGNDLSELKKKIDSPLADLIYYIRSGSTKKELLDKISELSNEEIRNKFKEVLEIAKENDVAIEINLGGFRRGIKEFSDGKRYPFPYSPLREIVKEVGNKVVIGVDSHNPKEFDNHEEYKLAIDFAKKHDIKIEERIEI